MKPPSDSALTWLHLPGRQDSLESFRAFALEHARTAGVPREVHAGIDLVIEEVLLNVFHYAFQAGETGTVGVGCAIAPDKCFLVRVTDPGKPFDPLQQPPPDLTLDIDDRPIGGLGIHLSKEMSSHMAYRRANDRNVLDIYFHISKK